MAKTRQRAFKVHRAILGLTQRAAAAKAKIQYDRFVRIERSWTDPEPKEIDAICRALQAEADALLLAPSRRHQQEAHS